MKTRVFLMIIALTAASCKDKEVAQAPVSSVMGTWKLISGTLIEDGDTTVTDYTKNVSFIKILNETHFAFLQHDLNKGVDSSAVFVSGGGKYTLTDDSYTEHLEYCSARDWEGNEFNFRVLVRGDTLIQSGVEKVDNLGVNRINIEKYIRLRK